MVPVDSDKIPRVSPYSGYHKKTEAFHLQGYHLLWRSFPEPSTILPFFYSMYMVLQPQYEYWFGLFPFRSPLLRKSIFLSFPPVTKMFQFTGLLSLSLCVHDRITVNYYCWVPPFGNLRIKAYLLLPEAYRCSSRPSSASNAKASTIRPYKFNHHCLYILFWWCDYNFLVKILMFYFRHFILK